MNAAILEKMKSFFVNKCRLCRKVFCCKDCRSLHEEEFHKVDPKCAICIYGKTIIDDILKSASDHVKTAHFPLNCVSCKKMFNNIDELTPQDKCSTNGHTLKIPRTPKTPITPVSENEGSSLTVTPFYRGIATSGVVSSAVTSTPLLVDGDAPIKFMQKSSLKLVGSVSLSDSKKNERRVTFNETPSIDYCKNKNQDDESSNEIYKSVPNDGEIYNTPRPYPSLNKEKENICDNILTHSHDTLWESALTNVDEISTASSTPHYNLSMEINIFSQSSDKVNITENKTTNLWTSMANMVKSVVNNMSITAQTSFSGISIKRLQPESDAASEEPNYKRMKLTELKCRRPIRHLSPVDQIRLQRTRYVDKATQTDEWL